MLTLRPSAAGLSASTAPQHAPLYAVGVCPCGASLPFGVRLGLRSRSRPVVEGHWTCSARCLDRQVTTMVHRELQTTPAKRPYRHRVPLGLVLLSSGAVKRDDLEHALALQHSTGERIGDVLQREYGLTEHAVAQALATQWGCGVLAAPALHPDIAACLAPHAVRTSTGMLPTHLGREGHIHIAFADTLDSQAVLALQRIHHVPVSAGITPVGTWMEGNATLAHAEGVMLEEMVCNDAAAMAREVVSIIRRLQPVESRFIRVRERYWLRIWLEPAALVAGPSQMVDVQDVVFQIAQSEDATPLRPRRKLSIL